MERRFFIGRGICRIHCNFRVEIRFSGAKVGDALQTWKLVERWHDTVVGAVPGTSITLDGTKIVVTETVLPPPPPPPQSTVIPWTFLLSEFTDLEWANIQKAINTQVSAGNGALARWVALSMMNGVDMANPQTLTYKGQLVAANILTQARADSIFVVP